MICTASVEETVPAFMRNTGKGWISERVQHAAAFHANPHSARGEQRTSKRAHARNSAVDRAIVASGSGLGRLGERTIWIDCDVIQADGGTRTASITGAFVALGWRWKRWWMPGP